MNLRTLAIWRRLLSGSICHRPEQSTHVEKKTISITTTDHEKSCFTVVLSCLANGTKLKPMIIFKRKTKPKEKFPPGLVVHHHPKGWMDVDGMKLWIQKDWSLRPGGLLRTRSLLVWDAFRAHLAEPVK